MTRQASEQGLRWYQATHFGMFIYWGLSAIAARGMGQHRRQRRQKYRIITTRYRDGFSMYDNSG